MTGMRKIAEELGMSVATVSRGLRQIPTVRSSTREAIIRKAQELGYEHNLYAGRLMSSIRKGRSQVFKGNMGLLWGSSVPAPGDDPRLLQIQNGVHEGAKRLGYIVNEFSLGQTSAKSLSRILLSRGIDGLLVTVPAFSVQKAYLRFDFEKFCTVCLGWGLLHPALHTVRFDYFYALRLALHHARHTFGKGIAALWDENTDRRAHRIARGAFVIHHPAGPTVANKLFINASKMKESSIQALFAKHKVRCLLVERGVQIPGWIRDSIPPRHHVIFQDPGDKPCFGWIDTQNSLMGKWGAELLAAKLSLRKTGIPNPRQVLLVPPSWKPVQMAMATPDMTTPEQLD